MHMLSKVNAASDVPFHLPVSISSSAPVTTLIAPSPNPEPPHATAFPTLDKPLITPSHVTRIRPSAAPVCVSLPLTHNHVEPTLRVPHHAAPLSNIPQHCTTSPAPMCVSPPLPDLPHSPTSAPLATPHNNTISPTLPPPSPHTLPPPLFHWYSPQTPLPPFLQT